MTDAEEDDPYAELGVPTIATARDIQHAYRVKAYQRHPDKGGNTADFQKLEGAYDLLSNPLRRAKYDRANAKNVYSKRRNAVPRPKASFVCSSNELTVLFDASATTSSRRSKAALTFTWAWDDGTPPLVTTAPTASHTYPQPGDYTVALTATNSGGSDTSTQDVSVNRLPVIEGFDTQIDGLHVVIRDIRVPPLTDPSFIFNWGDKTTSSDPVHTYRVAGRYRITITATNSEGSSPPMTKSILLNRAPAVHSVAAEIDELHVTDVRVEGDLGVEATLLFNWGDGTGSTVAPTHTYAKADGYTIKVTVTNSADSAFGSTVVVVSRPPTIYSLRTSIEDFYVSVADIDVRPDADPTFTYDWGDGSVSDWPCHGYERPGTYKVRVIASDDGGTFPLVKPIAVAWPPGLPDVAAAFGPFFMQHPIGPKDLAELARGAVRAKGSCLDVVEHLFRAHALKAYSHIDGCQDYGQLDEQWHRNATELETAVHSVLPLVPATERRSLRSTTADAAYLLLVLASEQDVVSLREQARSTDTVEARSLGWYRDLIERPFEPALEPASLCLRVKAGLAAGRLYEELEDAAERLISGADGLESLYTHGLAEASRLRQVPFQQWLQISPSDLPPPCPAHRSHAAEAVRLEQLLPLANDRLRRLEDRVEAEGVRQVNDADRLAIEDRRAARSKLRVRPVDRPRAPARDYGARGLLALFALLMGVVVAGGSLLIIRLNAVYADGLKSSHVLRDAFIPVVMLALCCVSLICCALCTKDVLLRLRDDAARWRSYQQALNDYCYAMHCYDSQRSDRDRAMQGALERYQQRRLHAEHLLRIGNHLRRAADQLCEPKLVAALRALVDRWRLSGREDDVAIGVDGQLPVRDVAEEAIGRLSAGVDIAPEMDEADGQADALAHFAADFAALDDRSSVDASEPGDESVRLASSTKYTGALTTEARVRTSPQFLREVAPPAKDCGADVAPTRFAPERALDLSLLGAGISTFLVCLWAVIWLLSKQHATDIANRAAGDPNDVPPFAVLALFPGALGLCALVFVISYFLDDR